METCQARNVPLPSCFRVRSGNAGGEVKNQSFMKFLAWLVHKHHFASPEMSQFRVGHSHGRVDQLFTVVGQALNKQGVLQTPSDFQKCMEKVSKTSSKLPHVVSQIGAMYDWQSYFEPLDISPHSHAQTRAMTLAHQELVWSQEASHTHHKPTTNTT